MLLSTLLSSGIDFTGMITKQQNSSVDDFMSVSLGAKHQLNMNSVKLLISEKPFV